MSLDVEKNSQLLTILHIFSMVKYVTYEHEVKNDTQKKGEIPWLIMYSELI